LKQDEILIYKLKGEKSLGKPRLRREFGMNAYVLGMWCDVGMDKGRLLYTVIYRHLPEVTVFLRVTAPTCFCYVCTKTVRRET
jgi:hypothetical protein